MNPDLSLKGLRNTLMGALLSPLLSPMQGFAHEGHDLPSDTPQTLSVQVSGALRYATANRPWPSDRTAGILSSSLHHDDQRNRPSLEHGMFLARWSPTAALGADWGIGFHDSPNPEIEVARVRSTFTVTPDLPLRIALGRMPVAMGAVVDAAGHLDVFSRNTLAKNAAVGERWIDDGVVLGTTLGKGDGLKGIELGFWRATSFPGGAARSAAQSLRLSAGIGAVHLEGFATASQAQARGSEASNAVVAHNHSHGGLDCRQSLLERVCFDGDTHLFGLSATWAPQPQDWQIKGAVIYREDRGSLYTSATTADYTGKATGAWVDLYRPLGPQWFTAARVEVLSPKNTLRGTNLTPLSQTAGLADADLKSALTLALGSHLNRNATVSFEAGTTQQGSTHERFALLRFKFQFDSRGP